MKRFVLRYMFLSGLPTALMLAFSASTGAQSVRDFTYTHLGQADGILSQRVYSIQQTTDDGALWWATLS